MTTRRVYANAGLILASLPGYDAPTADQDGLCFDSRWSGMQPFMSGQISSQNNTAGTVNYTTTLANPPLLVGYVGFPLGGQNAGLHMYRGNGIDRWLYAILETSYMQFYCQFGNVAATLHYQLFKRVGG